jgi:hypothetical protein
MVKLQAILINLVALNISIGIVPFIFVVMLGLGLLCVH